MSFIEAFGLGDAPPLPDDWYVQKTAQRLLKGKHRPSLAKWSITKEYGRWEVREPFAIRVSIFSPYPTFDTYDEAREHVIEAIYDHALGEASAL